MPRSAPPDDDSNNSISSGLRSCIFIGKILEVVLPLSNFIFKPNLSFEAISIKFLNSCSHANDFGSQYVWEIIGMNIRHFNLSLGSQKHHEIPISPSCRINVKINTYILLKCSFQLFFKVFNKKSNPSIVLIVFLTIADKYIVFVPLNYTRHLLSKMDMPYGRL